MYTRGRNTCKYITGYYTTYTCSATYMCCSISVLLRDKYNLYLPCTLYRGYILLTIHAHKTSVRHVAYICVQWVTLRNITMQHTPFRWLNLIHLHDEDENTFNINIHQAMHRVFTRSGVHNIKKIRCIRYRSTL